MIGINCNKVQTLHRLKIKTTQNCKGALKVRYGMNMTGAPKTFPPLNVLSLIVFTKSFHLLKRLLLFLLFTGWRIINRTIYFC